MQEHHEEHIDPERIARLGRGPRGPSPKVPTSRTTKRSARPPTRFVAYGRPQRVVVKVYVARHRSPQAGRQSVLRHVRYLARDSALRNAPNVRFFDASREQLDAKNETRSWATDRHHFRIVISPERGQDIADPTDYVRRVMARVEQDVGKLQWLAMHHSNTENPHTHVVLRGRSPLGTDLVLSRQYISQGIRERASEVATELLGERTADEVKTALAKEVTAERWTSLDGAIERFARPFEDRLRIDQKNITLSRYASLTPELLAKRLEFLAQLGLAERLPQRKTFPKQQPAWSLSSDFKQRLFELGTRNDIIKNLYASLGSEAAKLAPQVQRLQSGQIAKDVPPTMVRGTVVAKGAVNELTDERFVVVRDVAGKLQYVCSWAGDLHDALNVASIVDVGRSAHRRWSAHREILHVANANNSLYSTAGHRQWLRRHEPKLPAEQVERRLHRFANQLLQMTKMPGSGVTRAGSNAVQIDAEVLDRQAAQRGRFLDIRIVAAPALKDQIEAEAYTWIDRQILRTRLSGEIASTDIVHDPFVRSAMEKRSEWLIRNGYAKRDEQGAIEFLPGSTQRLNSAAQKNYALRWKELHGKSVSYLREKEILTAVYRGVVHLHAGPFAMLDTKQQLFAAPVSREPRMQKGQLVTARVVSKRHTELERASSRLPNKLLGLDR